jgi:hypothetical protein
MEQKILEHRQEAPRIASLFIIIIELKKNTRKPRPVN